MQSIPAATQTDLSFPGFFLVTTGWLLQTEIWLSLFAPFLWHMLLFLPEDEHVQLENPQGFYSSQFVCSSLFGRCHCVNLLNIWNVQLLECCRAYMNMRYISNHISYLWTFIHTFLAMTSFHPHSVFAVFWKFQTFLLFTGNFMTTTSSPTTERHIRCNYCAGVDSTN